MSQDIDIEQLMGKIRAEVWRRKKELKTSNNFDLIKRLSVGGDVAEGVLSLRRIPENSARIESKESYSVADFVRFHGEDFVQNTYRGVLRRESDVGGVSFYLHALREGKISKVEILGRLRYSKEGRTKGVKIKGLLPLFILRTVFRIPLLGSVLAVLYYCAKLPKIVKNIEAFETFVNSSNLDAARQQNQITSALESYINRLATNFDERAKNNADQIERMSELAVTIPQFTAYQSEVKAQAEKKFANMGVEIDVLRSRLFSLTQELGFLDSEQIAGIDEFYASFEDRFRGSPEEIKKRVEVYVPLVKEVVGATSAAVLDIGCGRGEWLQLLRENDIPATGLDVNQIMVQRCAAQGLDVREEEALRYLQGLPSGSLAAVTGFHIIEHLNFDGLVRLLDEVRRVLTPGGIAIFETPNPENLMVGACNFYYDPTHKKPLPPEPMKFLAEARGYSPVEIMRLHPPVLAEQFQDGTVSEWLKAPLDYAIVAYRPKQ